MTDIVNNALVVQEGEGASLSEIQARIYLIRGVQVMLDRDLAVFYMVDTGQLNRQVKRHKKRFPEDFMFQLTKAEWERLKCQIGISNARGGDRRSLPYVFTEQGVSSRNPKIAAYMHEYKLVKEYGEGVDRMYHELEEAGCPAPEFKLLKLLKPSKYCGV